MSDTLRSEMKIIRSNNNNKNITLISTGVYQVNYCVNTLLDVLSDDDQTTMAKEKLKCDVRRFLLPKQRREGVNV